MENKTGVTLNLDLTDMSFIQGGVTNIMHGIDDDYVTRIIMVFPLSPDEIFPGDYQVKYNAKTVDICLRVISSPEDDPIMKSGASLELWNFWNRGSFSSI